MNTIAVMTTTDSVDEARSIATALVERKLAACVHVSSIQSFYTWQGSVQNDDEFRVLVKTTDARYADVEAAILELHSYDLPAIDDLTVATDRPGFTKSFAPYSEWVADCVSGDVT